MAGVIGNNRLKGKPLGCSAQSPKGIIQFVKCGPEPGETAHSPMFRAVAAAKRRAGIAARPWIGSRHLNQACCKPEAPRFSNAERLLLPSSRSAFDDVDDLAGLRTYDDVAAVNQNELV